MSNNDGPRLLAMFSTLALAGFTECAALLGSNLSGFTRTLSFLLPLGYVLIAGFMLLLAGEISRYQASVIAFSATWGGALIYCALLGGRLPGDLQWIVALIGLALSLAILVIIILFTDGGAYSHLLEGDEESDQTKNGSAKK